jgi:hypothetical protein
MGFGGLRAGDLTAAQQPAGEHADDEPGDEGKDRCHDGLRTRG